LSYVSLNRPKKTNFTSREQVAFPAGAVP